MNKQAVNPYLPNYEYVPDGEPHVFDGRVYIYGSHDKFNGNEFCMKDYVCWSAAVNDLANWKYEGVIYSKTKDPRITDPQRRRIFAPDVQQGADGRFYLYYAFDFSSTIGVAVCDAPAGKYEYYGHVSYPDGTVLGEKEDDRFHYDPGVLADTTGRIYLYTGFCLSDEAKKRFDLPKPISDGAMVTELQQDMITIKRSPAVIVPNSGNAHNTSFAGHAFFEAASIRKINDTYYFIYSSENAHELCYATAKRPDGEYRYGGTIISNGDIFYQDRVEPLNYIGTNHGSIEKIGEQWYVFYHRQTNGNPYSRQGCAEKIAILANGRIPQVEMTSCGLNQAPLAGKGEYNAGIACCLMSNDGAAFYEPKKQISDSHPYFTQAGEDREDNPGQYVANMRNGAVAGYKYFNMSELKKIAVRTRGSGCGVIQILTDLLGLPFASIVISPSDEWSISSADCTLQPGVTALWFRYEGSKAIDFESFILE